VAFYAAFVDAGFLKAEGARALRRRRGQIFVNAAAVVDWAKSLNLGGNSFLRVYWYDGEFDPSDSRYASQRKMFEAIERVPGIKLRLGYVVERTPSWHHAVQRAIKACGWDVAEFQKHFRFEPVLQQKGVDSLITLDLVYMAEHTGYEWAVLIAGDRDLEEAVWTAQEEGRKVLLAVPKGAGVAPQLRRTADEVIELDTATLERFLPARQNRS
jgi:uncharacterized LabA/DUF88 family protein